MISTLKKYPWNQTDRITTKDQYLLFKTCFGMVSRLQRRMERKTDYPARLTVTLMKRFTSAICLCSGFTVHQKTNIADLINMDTQRRRDLGLPNDGLGWMHQYVTGVKMGFPLDLIDVSFLISLSLSPHRILIAPSGMSGSSTRKPSGPLTGYLFLSVRKSRRRAARLP